MPKQITNGDNAPMNNVILNSFNLKDKNIIFDDKLEKIKYKGRKCFFIIQRCTNPFTQVMLIENLLQTYLGPKQTLCMVAYSFLALKWHLHLLIH